MAKKTLLIDFDGTIAQYTGWTGPDNLGPPLESARHAMFLLAREYTIRCFTARPTEMVSNYLRAHGFPQMTVTNKKDPAHLIIDDRALTFTGQWTQEFIDSIRAFSPWWELRKSEDQVSSQASSQSSPAPE